MEKINFAKGFCLILLIYGHSCYGQNFFEDGWYPQ